MLTNKPAEWISGEDIILHIIGMIGVDGALYKSMEFVGDGIQYLSMDDRFTIANMAIEAGGKNGIFPVDAKAIDYMKEHPEEFTAINVSDAQSFQNSLAKRIADMQITEYIFNQNLFQIRAIQHNNMSLSDKAESIATTVIPIWKNQLALSVIMANQQESIAAQKKITDTTNQILRKNSEMMKMNSINVAKANEEAIVSLDTLQATTKDLIDTITEVKKIQSEGNKMRETLEHNLIEYGSQLTNKINELANE